MTRERKSPQEKKELEYTRDHFTFGWNSSRMFPRGWKKKKAHTNREYRHKSQEILSKVKPETTADEIEATADDLTSARFTKSISRKRLRKVGTVSLGQKVKRKLQEREAMAGRRVKKRLQDDQRAAAAISVLSRLEGDDRLKAVRSAGLLAGPDPRSELGRILASKSEVDRVLYFLYLVMAGSRWEVSAIERNPGLGKAMNIWCETANRILKSDQRRQAKQGPSKSTTRKRTN